MKKYFRQIKLFQNIKKIILPIYLNFKKHVTGNTDIFLFGLSNFRPLDNITRMAPCSQEETDTRMFLHVADAVQSGFTGFRKIVVRTVDTNVLVLAVALLDKLQTLTEGHVHLWVTFVTGMNLCYLAAHDIARSFVNGAALALHAFHAFNGCDTMSCFHGKGKKKARTPGNAS